MTRTIKPSEIKPGMTIQWTYNKVTYECTVMDRDYTDRDGGVLCHVSEKHAEYVDAEAGKVTVLSEPAPTQPEEPTGFGARVVMNGRRFLRAPEEEFVVEPWLEEGEGFWLDWDDLCEMGPVTVIPDQGWTVPADGGDDQEVPERIEEWPEDDTALRKYTWVSSINVKWIYLSDLMSWRIMEEKGSRITPWGSTHPRVGPWTRVDEVGNE